MSFMPLFTALKSQAVVIGAALLVGGFAIGTATTGSANPAVWGVRLMDSNGRGGSTGAPSTSTPTPTVSPSPDEVNSPEPTESAEPSDSPQPKETPEPKETSNPGESSGEGGDD